MQCEAPVCEAPVDEKLAGIANFSVRLCRVHYGTLQIWSVTLAAAMVHRSWRVYEHMQHQCHRKHKTATESATEQPRAHAVPIGLCGTSTAGASVETLARRVGQSFIT